MKMIFLVFLTLAVISTPGTAVWCADSPPTTVKLVSGIVQGTQENGVAVFLGIPYAAPPVGNLRWQPPQSVSPWQGVRSAASFGPACPQPEVSELEGGGNLGRLAEDCLYLNIWKPANSGEKKLPVMVWIHGGGFLVGAGSGPEYPGEGDFLSDANRFLTALWFTEPARFLARAMTTKGAPAYRYQFTHVPDSFWMAGKGAYHGVEIPYVFGNVGKDDPSETDKRLSETITAYWIRFAAQGNPNAAGLPAWPAYDRASEPYLELGEGISVKSGLDRQACDLIEKIRRTDTAFLF